MSGYPPSPWSIGIIVLEGNFEMIYGAQSLGAKILMSKNLQLEILMTKTQNGTMWSLLTVTASVIIERLM